jgi:RNA polymerase sigma-70 factor (ECF subfamily)
MCATWKTVQASLAGSLGCSDTTTRFDAMKERHAALHRFHDANSLVTYLNGRDGDRDEKDAIYASLVVAAQGALPESPLAVTLLWLGLWPALDVVFRRRRRFFAGRLDELVSAIGEGFMTRLARTDVRKVRRFAMTLARGTDRAVVCALSRAWAEEARLDALPSDDVLDELRGASTTSLFGLPSGQPAGRDIEALSALLRDLAGDDAEIVTAAALYGETHRETAERIGLSHAAARKRYARALARVRSRLACPSPARQGEFLQ